VAVLGGSPRAQTDGAEGRSQAGKLLHRGEAGLFQLGDDAAEEELRVGVLPRGVGVGEKMADVGQADRTMRRRQATAEKRQSAV
jgi:hypothetical protein